MTGWKNKNVSSTVRFSMVASNRLRADVWSGRACGGDEKICGHDEARGREGVFGKGDMFGRSACTPKSAYSTGRDE